MGNEKIIDINEFAKLDLRIAKIENAERIEGSKKLIRLEVDIGNEKRQLVAGIAEEYNPAKLMGVESRGMILAVDVNGKPILLRPDKEVPASCRIQ